MLIDCDSCAVRGAACGDCVVTVLLGSPPAGVELDATEQAAIAALSEHGLVPPLRLVSDTVASEARECAPGRSARQRRAAVS